jgi:hypothetical protein
MRLHRSLVFPSLAVGFVAFGAKNARAQGAHWDLGAEVGLMKRFTTGSDVAAPNPSFGPVFELHGHVALVPMLRIGAYVAHDISPASGIAARQITAGGLRAKLVPPWPGGNFRSWIFAGIGYARTYAPSYHVSEQLSPNDTQPRDVSVDGVAGGMLEAPLGVGLAYKLRRPWELTAELGTRWGLAYTGSMYSDGASGHALGYPSVLQPFMGKDTLAVYLSVGLSFEL